MDSEEQARRDAVLALKARRERSEREGQIDNGSLMAGSPMYYYCKYCGIHTDTKPENWWQSPPRSVCSECQDLLSRGWHDEATPRFPRKDRL